MTFDPDLERFSLFISLFLKLKSKQSRKIELREKKKRRNALQLLLTGRHMCVYVCVPVSLTHFGRVSDVRVREEEEKTRERKKKKKKSRLFALAFRDCRHQEKDSHSLSLGQSPFELSFPFPPTLWSHSHPSFLYLNSIITITIDSTLGLLS